MSRVDESSRIARQVATSWVPTRRIKEQTGKAQSTGKMEDQKAQQLVAEP